MKLQWQVNLDRPADAVFAAWSREEAQRAWSDPGEGWELSFDQFQFAVGETDVCRFGPAGGKQYINENRYLEIEPGKRIVYSTSLLIEQGLYFDGQDDVEGHRSGWESMLGALGKYLDGGRP
ncbi:ATPase [Sinorhizobium meliloti]|uniref:SRPBCC domain-containing protein n=1 Tax=Rhizobium meliloti TaxID=382 RepID=UPI000FDB8901|nr:SRPBCC domain-containing protein [Sinorhizobium meliloti]MDW9589571.1 ATPase [Sinorhizobium meliloti]MDW9856082.1 ATPase [Sinorhizobium meliloti]MDW9874810.1 ATPase [Sinorhizobium meliloti]MDW9887039.1 ATPase [Sinorhizobium meliloti]MDX0209183.1 ATPase [Sinorhizobium meliloti]